MNPEPWREIAQSEIDALFQAGEFSAAIRQAAPKVVVLMTQGWCPQWHEMQSWLPEFAGRAALFRLVYDQHPDFQRIMDFKERSFGNYEVPYLRYYHEGRLILACNWLPKRSFAALLERTEPFRLA